jgi:hypothetical protein
VQICSLAALTACAAATTVTRLEALLDARPSSPRLSRGGKAASAKACTAEALNTRAKKACKEEKHAHGSTHDGKWAIRHVERNRER